MRAAGLGGAGGGACANFAGAKTTGPSTGTAKFTWAGFAATDGREHGLDLMGTNAGLSLYPARLLRNCPDGSETVHLNSAKIPYSEDVVHHFVSCVLDGKKPLVTLEESFRVQQILDAIYLSSTTGKEVKLKS